MDFGAGYFPTHDGMRPGEIARRPWSVVEPAPAKWEAAIGELTGR
ncbi:hypothetical protein [Paractinoplanes hotanensis]|nr:hypothetical protein [Actinoplanes hotanensis]